MVKQDIEQNSPDFIKKVEWPPNFLDLNPLDYYVRGALTEKNHAITRSQMTRQN